MIFLKNIFNKTNGQTMYKKSTVLTIKIICVAAIDSGLCSLSHVDSVACLGLV
jgi:hypothetical protein